MARSHLKRQHHAPSKGDLRGRTRQIETTVPWDLGQVADTRHQQTIINHAPHHADLGYNQNAGNTLREGIEAKVTYKWNRLNFYANYTYIDATYRNALTISSPNNPAANANGDIFVTPGDHIPAVPSQQFKLGASLPHRF